MPNPFEPPFASVTQETASAELDQSVAISTNDIIGGAWTHGHAFAMGNLRVSVIVSHKSCETKSAERHLGNKAVHVFSDRFVTNHLYGVGEVPGCILLGTSGIANGNTRLCLS